MTNLGAAETARILPRISPRIHSEVTTNLEAAETSRMAELEPLTECNTVLLVFDCLRFDTARIARTPNLDRIGRLHKAHTLATYTPAAHFAMFAGHLPSIREGIRVPFYHEPTKQMWRIMTAPERDANRGCGILFDGTDVVDGFRRLDFFVQGIGGVSQFSTGSALRTKFDWSDFIYFGPDLNEELMKPREAKTFPLNHIDEIVSRLEKQPQWFLFINNPEAHYPYDWGDGIDDEIQRDALPRLGKVVNLRSMRPGLENVKRELLPFAPQLHAMQIKGLEALDRKLGDLFDELWLLSQRPVCVVGVGDHGENFGEKYGGLELFGHFHPTPENVEVPLWIGTL